MDLVAGDGRDLVERGGSTVAPGLPVTSTPVFAPTGYSDTPPGASEIPRLNVLVSVWILFSAV